MKRKAKMMKLSWNQMETHKKANRNINGRVEYDQHNPNLKKMKIISGKLLQTSSIQIPMLTDKQKKRKNGSCL